MTRYTIHFAGHVQGVGFRYTARGVGRGFLVAGVVENLDDGRVLLVIEGEEQELDRFVQELCDAMSGYVHEKTIARGPATGEYGAPGPGMVRIAF